MAVDPAAVMQAAAPAFRPDEEEHVEIPTLGREPTEAELIAYAAAHPNVRAAMRVFRGKIVEVNKG